MSYNKKFHSKRKIAKGNGPNGEGVRHWQYQRITALISIPFTFWTIYIARELYQQGIDGAAHLFAHPLNFSFLVILLITSFYHSMLGMQVILEDYIHHKSCQAMTVLLMKLFTILTLVLTIINLTYKIFII